MEKCEICGGKLNITIGSDIAVCDSCGNSATIPAGDVRRYQDIYKSAETLLRLNSISGYEDAIRKLQPIAFIPQAQEKIAFCENRIGELRERQQKQEKSKEESDKRDSKTGVIVIVVICLLLLTLIAGAVILGIHLFRGDLSPRAIAIIVAAIVAVIVVAIIGKIRS